MFSFLITTTVNVGLKCWQRREICSDRKKKREIYKTKSNAEGFRIFFSIVEMKKWHVTGLTFLPFPLVFITFDLSQLLPHFYIYFQFITSNHSYWDFPLNWFFDHFPFVSVCFSLTPKLSFFSDRRGMSIFSLFFFRLPPIGKDLLPSHLSYYTNGNFSFSFFFDSSHQILGMAKTAVSMVNLKKNVSKYKLNQKQKEIQFLVDCQFFDVCIC